MNKALKQASDSLANSKLEAEKMIKENKILQEKTAIVIDNCAVYFYIKRKNKRLNYERIHPEWLHELDRIQQCYGS